MPYKEMLEEMCKNVESHVNQRYGLTAQRMLDQFNLFPQYDVSNTQKNRGICCDFMKSYECLYKEKKERDSIYNASKAALVCAAGGGLLGGEIGTLFGASLIGGAAGVVICGGIAYRVNRQKDKAFCAEFESEKQKLFEKALEKLRDENV